MATASFETRMSEWTGAPMAIHSEVSLVSKSGTAIALFEIPVTGWTEASVAMYPKILSATEFKVAKASFEAGTLVAMGLGVSLMKKSETATASLKTRISGSEAVRSKISLLKKFETVACPEVLLENESEVAAVSFEMEMLKWIGAPMATCLEELLVNESEMTMEVGMLLVLSLGYANS